MDHHWRIAWLCVICLWLVLRWVRVLDIGKANERPLVNYLRLSCALLSYSFAVVSVIQSDWIGTCLWAYACIIEVWDYWNDDENKKRRKKLWGRVKRRVRIRASGRLGVSET